MARCSQPDRSIEAGGNSIHCSTVSHRCLRTRYNARMILCVGTTPALQRVMIFPKLVPDQPNRAAQVLQCPAGKAVNVAKVLTVLGERCLVSGFLGGSSGQLIRRDLDATGVSHQFVEIAPATRLCVTLIDQSADTATEAVEDPAAVESPAWDTLRQLIHDALPKAALLVLSGSLPPGAPEDFYADCVRAATALGIRTILDARGEPLRRALGHQPFVVKPNRAELAETVGFSLDSEDALREAIRKLIAAGPTCTIITLGADGCVISDGKNFWRLHVPRVRPVSAVGSGDAFTAGMAAAISRGVDLPQAAALASACGISNALSPLPGDVRLDEVRRFEQQIRLTER
jgi:tagatose 6-phosphate kinase